MAHDEIIGERLFAIRAACGDGPRDPETLEAFAARVLKRTGETYNPVTLSMMERGKRRWLVSDCITLATVDPEQRGAVWLSALADAAPVEHPKPVSRPPPPQPIDPAAYKPVPRSTKGKGQRRAGGT